MSGFRAFMERYEEQKLLIDFTLEESKAVFDLLLLTVMIDGEITQDELDQLSDESERFPFGSAEEFAEIIEDHAVATKAELDDIVGDDEAVEEFIADRAEVLDDEEKRREALAMVAVVAYADGVDPTEEDLCHTIGEVFGFDVDEIEDILLDGSIANIG